GGFAMKRALSVLLLGLVIGCSTQVTVPPRSGPSEEDREKTRASETPTNAAVIQMVPIKMKDFLEKQVANNKAKVVLIDVWGFFCPPCKEEFPNLVRLHHAYAEKGLVCISLSLDYNEELKKKSVKFLNDNKAVCANFWLEEGFEGAGREWKNSKG